MDNLVLFVSNNLMLVMGFIVLLLMLLMNILGPRFRGYQNITPTTATILINQEDALVLDVRQDNEYKDGHIINSKHIPLNYLKDRMSGIDGHKNKPVIAVCRSGSRSSHACAVLKKAGFETVYNLSGGVMAWQSANLPLTRK